MAKKIKLNTIREKASYYRLALLLGLVQGEEVVLWAEKILDSDHTASSGLSEIVL